MNAISASPAKLTETGTATRKILVWDAPVRVFHWLMVLCFAGAYITSEGEAWKLVHITLGYTMAGLVAFRIVWGLLGTRYARFSAFIRGPKAVSRYVGSLLRGRPEHHLGHNPAGAVAIVLLLVLTLLVVASGWASYNELAGGWVVSALMLSAVLSFWWMQWQSAPSGGGFSDRPVASAKAGDSDRDND